MGKFIPSYGVVRQDGFLPSQEWGTYGGDGNEI